jgi:hypothetical protein
MDLRTALRVVGTPLHFSGRSDLDLVEKLRPRLIADEDWIHYVSCLNSGVRMRPADLLRALAVATRPRYEREVHDVCAFWALLRYIGVFAEKASGHCGLSKAGRRILGNQRRVMSEEVGIGMAAALAGSWMASSRGGRSTAVELIDIDILLESGASWLTKAPGATRRPDYLVINKGLDSAYIGLLECKGSKFPRNAVSQLASAYGQLGGLLVGGRPVRGLAVSATVADGGVSYSAVQRIPPLLDDAGGRLRATDVSAEWLEAFFGERY